MCDEPDTGLRPHLYLCTDYDGEPNCLDLEMTGAKFRTLEELDELAASMFQPFADGLKILKTCIDTALFFGDDEGEMHDELVDSIGKAVVRDSSETNISENPIDKSPKKDTIKSKKTTEDGGPGSGNYGHKGVPGETGGSAPGPGSVSSDGENAPCKGFAKPAKLKDHAKRHGPEFGTISEKEYEQLGIDFLRQPCGGDIVGYSTPDGKVVRFNMKTTEYASGYPGSALCTYMKAKCNRNTHEIRPDKAMEYYTGRKFDDLEGDSE